MERSEDESMESPRQALGRVHGRVPLGVLLGSFLGVCTPTHTSFRPYSVQLHPTRTPRHS